MDKKRARKTDAGVPRDRARAAAQPPRRGPAEAVRPPLDLLDLAAANGADKALAGLQERPGEPFQASGPDGKPAAHRQAVDRVRASLTLPTRQAAPQAGGTASAASSPPAGPDHHPPRAIASARDLGELVREARDELQLSQQAFADLVGVGRRFISELENGKLTLELGKVLEVASAAGIDVLARRRR
jgi:HTH-type transcriptional regulator/antitoxin HipB